MEMKEAAYWVERLVLPTVADLVTVMVDVLEQKPADDWADNWAL